MLQHRPKSHAEIIEPLLGTVPLIICQKPFCTSLKEAKTLTSIALASRTKLTIHENFRFMPWYRIIKER